ncbi:MAG: dethiobiotin synthase [Candidatus Omnitrophica bacterium]|nr:dethiobiotin synthase [Candidatus Omnitrophota bacterium]
MNGIFVTGTDTGVGKTIVTSLLARFLKEKSYRVATQKWIETGCRNLNKPCPLTRTYRFKFPASPHLAARSEKRSIQEVKIKRSFKLLAKNFDFVIVEGIGGALVPFSKKRLVIDIAKDLNLPTIVVVANKLGAINHTLLTIEAIRKRKMKIIGLVFNNLKPKENKIVVKDNPQIVKAISQEKILGILPYSRSKNFLYKKFIPIGKKLI